MTNISANVLMKLSLQIQYIVILKEFMKYKIYQEIFYKLVLLNVLRFSDIYDRFQIIYHVFAA